MRKLSVVGALLASTAACGGGDSGVIDAGGVMVVVGGSPDEGDSALVEGTVAVVDGCLGIGDYVAMWPRGTRVTDTDGPVIDVPRLGTVHLGDHVSGGGGYHPAGEFTGHGAIATPESCAARDVVVYRPG